MVARDIVVKADVFDQDVDFGRLDWMLCYEARVFEDQPCQVYEVVISETENGEVDVVQIREDGRFFGLLRNRYDLKDI